MNKKAQELTLTKALAIAIGIVVLIILIYGFATKSGIFKEQAFGCESKQGCHCMNLSTSSCEGSLTSGECPQGLVCCMDLMNVQTSPPSSSSSSASGENRDYGNLCGDITIEEGFQLLKDMEFPENGAAYLAGNIQQESSWASCTQEDISGYDEGTQQAVEQASQGADTVGGIGLIQWTGPRRTKYENWRDSNNKQGSIQDQLDYMVIEMRGTNYYIGAYNTFKDPDSTSQSLKSASRSYWGYGIEGQRYQYAEQLLNE